jgi:hypothetical protein
MLAIETVVKIVIKACLIIVKENAIVNTACLIIFIKPTKNNNHSMLAIETVVKIVIKACLIIVKENVIVNTACLIIFIKTY